MSLATRCTACGTIFRVVQDQLKVSEGWVRCGRCDEVFNALESLFDLTREQPPKWEAEQSERARAETAERREAHFEASEDEQPTIAELDEEDRIASRFFHPEQRDVQQSPAQAVAERDRTDFADAQFDPESANETPAEAEPTPGFMLKAQRDARRRRPLPRLLMSLAALALLLLLAVQVGHQFRDGIAARWPQARPVLAHACAWMGCRIDAPRRIDDIAVESSALARSGGAGQRYQLSVTLRNRGAWLVAMPAIELSLTDIGGQLVARRVLTSADFRSAPSVIRPGAEAALQLLLSTGDAAVAGYTVEVFYP